jgi:putative endonuclease
MQTRTMLGRAGEQLACDLYRKLGFEVVDRNWRCPAGEVDLIVRRADVVVFCEVKTRSNDRYGLPAEAVGAIKQARLRRLAGAWLDHRAAPPVARVRFDVVSIIVCGSETRITHLPDAF